MIVRIVNSLHTLNDKFLTTLKETNKQASKYWSKSLATIVRATGLPDRIRENTIVTNVGTTEKRKFS